VGTGGAKKKRGRRETGEKIVELEHFQRGALSKKKDGRGRNLVESPISDSLVGTDIDQWEEQSVQEP